MKECLSLNSLFYTNVARERLYGLCQRQYPKVSNCYRGFDSLVTNAEPHYFAKTTNVGNYRIVNFLKLYYSESSLNS